MGRNISPERKQITEKIFAMKPGDQFEVATLSQVGMAMQAARTRNLGDKKCPDIFSRGLIIMALEQKPSTV